MRTFCFFPEIGSLTSKYHFMQLHDRVYHITIHMSLHPLAFNPCRNRRSHKISFFLLSCLLKSTHQKPAGIDQHPKINQTFVRSTPYNQFRTILYNSVHFPRSGIIYCRRTICLQHPGSPGAFGLLVLLLFLQIKTRYGRLFDALVSTPNHEAGSVFEISGESASIPIASQ